MTDVQIERLKASDPGAMAEVEDFLRPRSSLERSQVYAFIAQTISPPWGSPATAFRAAYPYVRKAVEQSLAVHHQVEKLALLSGMLGDADGCRWLAGRLLAEGRAPSDVTLARLEDCIPASTSWEMRALVKKYGREFEMRDRSAEVPTARNYRSLRQLLAEHGICLVAMQYPLMPVEPLRRFFRDETATPGAPAGLYILGNEDNFRRALLEGRYEDLFYDRFAVEFGHATDRGNRLIAVNLAKLIERLVRDGSCAARPARRNPAGHGVARLGPGDPHD